MSNEILVNVNPQETRVALLESGVLQEVIIQRADRHGLAGNVYLGRVVRVLPGMQAAFVEIGLERTAFLHQKDICRPTLSKGDKAVEDGEAEIVPIQQLVTEGQSLLVQVLKDPMGTKGARLTTRISIPSRYLVLLPDGEGAGVSVKIEDEDERSRLKTVIESLIEKHGFGHGYIVRTAGEGRVADELLADMQFLDKLWTSVTAQVEGAKPPCLIHGDLPLAMRILRDLIGTQVDKVRIDSSEDARQVEAFARVFVPEMADRIEHYDDEGPIFDLYSVEDELQKALNRKVMLKSGGYLIIDQTEAMVIVDVNTGGFVGHRTQEETILKTNLEAAQSLVRQLRLRNLGGIIIIDFIDMQSQEHREMVLAALDKALQRDPARSVISGMTQLGLVEMTRKRTRESLEHILCQPCPLCEGIGSIKSVDSVCQDIFRELMRSARQFDADELRVLAAPDVVAMLLDEQSTTLAELEDQIGKPIRLQSEDLYAPDEFDVVLV